MPNYIELIGKHYPNVSALCSGDPTVYTQVEHLGGDPLPLQADLDAKYLEDYQENRIAELSALCAYDIVNGFQSDAGGLHTAAKWYDSQPEDQVNLIGSVAVGDSMLFPCRDTQGGTKSYTMHTHEQLQAVMRDGRDVKLSKLQTFTTKQAAVLQAGSVSAVDDVTWP